MLLEAVEHYRDLRAELVRSGKVAEGNIDELELPSSLIGMVQAVSNFTHLDALGQIADFPSAPRMVEWANKIVSQRLAMWKRFQGNIQDDVQHVEAVLHAIEQELAQRTHREYEWDW